MERDTRYLTLTDLGSRRGPIADRKDEKILVRLPDDELLHTMLLHLPLPYDCC